MMKLNIQLFGSTNKTANYDLPQFVGTDKPTWLGDVNTAMADIDNGMSVNASAIDSLGSRVTSAEGVASQASTDVSSLRTTVSTLQSNVQSVTTTANNAQSTATSALNTANTAVSKADTNTSNIGDLTDLQTTTKTSAVSAINEVLSEIPEDTGWLTLPLASGVSVSGDAVPQYRRYGKTVFVRGYFTFNKTSDAKTLATLPEGFRSSYRFDFFTATAGTRIGRTYIDTSGNIVCDWIYSVGGSAYTGTVNWYDFEISFEVD